MTDKPTITIDSIPIEALAEARNALADKYIKLKTEIEKPSLITRMHKKRTQTRILKIEKYLVQLDVWIEKVQK